MTLPTIAIDSSITLMERDWATERMTAQARLEELRRERGASVLDGGTFDHRAILDAEATLDAIQAAEVEETRRYRAAQEAAGAKKRQERRKELREALAKRTAAMKAAEKHVKGLAAALTSLNQSNKEAYALVRSLGGTAWTLSDDAIADMAAWRIAYALQPVSYSMVNIIQFPQVSAPFLPDGTRTDDHWWEADEKKIAAEIGAALETE